MRIMLHYLFQHATPKTQPVFGVVCFLKPVKSVGSIASVVAVNADHGWGWDAALAGHGKIEL